MLSKFVDGCINVQYAILKVIRSLFEEKHVMNSQSVKLLTSMVCILIRGVHCLRIYIVNIIL